MLSAVFLFAALTSARAGEIGRLTSPDGLTLVFKASPVANLVYQLDCFAGISACTPEAYRELWSGFKWSKRDDETVARWAAFMKRSEQTISFGEPEPAGALPLSPRGVQLQERVRIASLRSETWEEYRDNLGQLLRSSDAREALELIEILRPRFDAWWQAEGRRRAEGGAAAVYALAKRKDLPAFLAQAAHFYGYDFPKGETVHYDFIAQPRSKAQHAGAEELSQYALVESVPDERPEDRLDVVAHELFHYFYAQAGTQREAALIASFAASTAPYSLAAYGLLNESVATALGNGLVSRMTKSPEEFQHYLAMPNALYDDPVINGVAKSLLNPADRWLKTGVRLGDETFVSEYLLAVSSGLGAGLMSPGVWFRSVGAAFDDELRGASDHFIRRMGANNGWSYSLTHEDGPRQLAARTGLSWAFFLKPENLKSLGLWGPELAGQAGSAMTAEARKGRPFVYGLRRSAKAYLYVFVAPDEAAIKALIERFAAQPKLFLGVMP